MSRKITASFPTRTSTTMVSVNNRPGIESKIEATAGICTDEPPPLEDMSKVIGCLRPSKSTLDGVCSKLPARRSTDSTTLANLGTSQNGRQSAISEGFKRGFLDAKYHEERAKSHKTKKDLPFLKADRTYGNSEPKYIPDFLRVKLEDSPQDKLRKELIDMLEPTKDLVKDVMDDESIKSGLEDPEVMLAVQEIAENPHSANNYRKNPKVMNFYSCLGMVMGDKIQAQEANTKSKT